MKTTAAEVETLNDVSQEDMPQASSRVSGYQALANRLLGSFACPAGTVSVAVPFALIELWSNLWHDPFSPQHRSAQSWTIFRFSLYGALFIAASGWGIVFGAMTVLRYDSRARSRLRTLTLALVGALLYALFHHSRHVLRYWAPGGTW